MSDDPYVYPGTLVLRNKPGIRDAALLDFHERELVTDRMALGVPSGQFDLRHLQAIHKHLFQDVYDWAGKLRTLDISKGGNQFQAMAYIQTGFGHVHGRLVAARFLAGLSGAEFAMRAGEIMGDVNYVHPFRDGNGRAQLQYLKQLAARAKHPIDLTKLTPAGWLHASREAHLGRYGAMREAISAACG